MANNASASLPRSLQRDQFRGPLIQDSTTGLLLGPLNHLNSVAQQLLQSLSPPHTKPPHPPSITALAEADAALASAVQLAHIHQKKQKRIEALKSDVLALENSWRNVIVQLEEGRRDLEAIIAEGDVRLDAIEQAKAGTATLIGFDAAITSVVGAIPYPELLAYAQSLSAFTSAPPNLPDLSLPGQPPPPLFFPPFPNEEKMRRGHLNAEEPLGPLGETHSVGRPPSPSPEPHRGQAANPYRPMDNRPPQQMFDLDLDLNPDL
ncbi:vitamin-D-receptor interacting mediator subunit 4-domain-containing protein [Lactarius sanguifluus]|nr:vitamin-D-receptor interacting mediator subunit 4-domain-containing protein [Lactarius sanguifluus]